MAKYLLDFTETPLKPEAGGQLHIVTVGKGGHESVTAAIADLILSHDLVGTTEAFCPLALVRVTNIGDQGSYIQEVQVEPASAAPDYYQHSIKPLPTEVLTAFPLAKDVSVTSDAQHKRTFRLHQTRFTVEILAPDRCAIEAIDDEDYGPAYSSYGGSDWAAALRSLASGALDNMREEIARLTAEADAFLAAVDAGYVDTPPYPLPTEETVRVAVPCAFAFECPREGVLTFSVTSSIFVQLEALGAGKFDITVLDEEDGSPLAAGQSDGPWQEALRSLLVSALDQLRTVSRNTNRQAAVLEAAIGGAK
jgi:hypothetical protein